ncbi:MAG: formylglycine-generating enzyme family protein [Oligoflexia bacterium]|nr:formylglycine-generating enzyme family protein [Oligoflexia bacterium]
MLLLTSVHFFSALQKYIRRLNALFFCRKGHPTGRIRLSGICYRLPTEAEWEWAVRAGTKTAYFFGNDSSQLGRYAIYGKNSIGTRAVKGDRSPNPWGLYDVYGNVWEWVQDAWQRELPGKKDPLVTTGSNRVVRGGSWSNDARSLRSAFRHDGHPNYGNYRVGFRLVRTRNP